MPKTKAEKNVEYLKSIRRNSSDVNNHRINEIIDLYSQRKIPNLKTAENVIRLLSSKHKSQQQKAYNTYMETITKYDSEKYQNFAVDLILYKEPLSSDDLENLKKKKLLYKKLKQVYIGQVIVNTLVAVDRLKRTRTVEYSIDRKIDGSNETEKIYCKMGITFADFLREHGTVYNLLEKYLHKLLTVSKLSLGRNATKTEIRDFFLMEEVLKSDLDMIDMFMHWGEDYICGIYIRKITPLERKVKKYDPLKSKKREATKISTNFRYLSTELDLSENNFKDALNKYNKITAKCWIKSLRKFDKSGIPMTKKNLFKLIDYTNDKSRALIQRKHNYVENECWINTLYDVYGDNLLSSTKKRNAVTREIILQIINKTEDDIKNGLSVHDILPFFVHFRLQLRVYDRFSKLVFSYDPPIRNHHNKVLYCLMDYDHIYTLNHDLKRLEQKQDDDDEFVLYASSDYIVKKEDEEDKPIHYRMINNIDDIIRIRRENEYTEKDLVYLIHREDDLQKLLFELDDAGFSEPGIKYETGRIVNIILNINRTCFIIKTQQLCTSSIQRPICVDSEDVYNRMSDAMTKFNRQMFKSHHKSYYTKQDIDILDEYRTVSNVGMICTRTKHRLNEIDMSKAYTASLIQINKIGVFNEFDCFQPYEGQAILDYGLYIVKAKNLDLYYNKTYNLSYGMFLKDPEDVKDVEILAYKVPSTTRSVNYKAIVDELYATKISDNPDEDVYIKKLISNINIGLLEKANNKRQKSFLFKDLSDLKHHQNKYGGNLNIVSEYQDQEVTTIKETSPLDVGINMDDDDDDNDDFAVNNISTPTGKELYVLNINKSATLINGFRYIKELVLQRHNYFMNKSYKKLQEQNITVYSVKTDAFTIKESDVEKAKELLNFEPGIGNWRLSKTEDIIYPLTRLALKLNHEIPIKKLEVKHLDVPDEYDTEAICKQLIEHRRVINLGELPGVGKSYNCKYLSTLGYNVLLICPTNELCKDNENNDLAITTNRFFGVSVSEEAKMKKFDDSPYDVIVFEEIYLNGLVILRKIKEYIDTHPDKIILATGDPSQNKPVEILSTEIEHKIYADHCISIMFPNQIKFNISKRLKSEEGRQKLHNIKAAVFNEDIPIHKTIKKYFKFTKNPSESNISYRNEIAEDVSNARRRILNKTSEYEIGEKLLCKSYFKTSGYIFSNTSDEPKNRRYNCSKNCSYEITEITEDKMTIKDTFNDIVKSSELEFTELKYKVIREKNDYTLISYDIYITLPIGMVRAKFIHNYCRTGDSIQGITIKTAITIYDWNFFYASREWIWTALTRAQDLDQIYFYDGDLPEFNHERLKQYFKKKIVGYIDQDKKAKRPINKDNYITVDWLVDAFGRGCSSCNVPFTYSVSKNYNVNFSCELTADRIDNAVGHELDNIVPMCYTCNCSKSNK